MSGVCLEPKIGTSSGNFTLSAWISGCLKFLKKILHILCFPYIYIIRCSFPEDFIECTFFMLYSMFENQRLSEKVAFSYEKSAWSIWRICCKAVILHPLSREKRRWVEMLNGDEVLDRRPSRIFFWKKLQKVLVVQK